MPVQARIIRPLLSLERLSLRPPSWALLGAHPIFGVVGDLFQVIPPLKEELKKLRG
jgi:hypothetical protein